MIKREIYKRCSRRSKQAVGKGCLKLEGLQPTLLRAPKGTQTAMFGWVLNSNLSIVFHSAAHGATKRQSYEKLL